MYNSSDSGLFAVRYIVIPDVRIYLKKSEKLTTPTMKKLLNKVSMLDYTNNNKYEDGPFTNKCASNSKRGKIRCIVLNFQKVISNYKHIVRHEDAL